MVVLEFTYELRYHSIGLERPIALSAYRYRCGVHRRLYLP